MSSAGFEVGIFVHPRPKLIQVKFFHFLAHMFLHIFIIDYRVLYNFLMTTYLLKKMNWVKRLTPNHFNPQYAYLVLCVLFCFFG